MTHWFLKIKITIKSRIKIKIKNQIEFYNIIKY